MRLWNFRHSPDSYRRLSGHPGREAWTLAFHPDGSVLASGGDDGLVRLWDLPSGRELAGLRGHRQTVTSIDFLHGGDRLASASLDGTLRIWDLPDHGPAAGNTEHRPTVFSTPGDRLHALAVSRDGRLLAAAGRAGKIYLQELAKARRVTRGRRASQGRAFAGVRPLESVVRLCLRRSDGRHVEPRQGQIADEKPADGAMKAVAFSADGLMLAGGGDEHGVTLWSMSDQDVHARLIGHPLPVRGIAFTPDNRVVATACDDEKVRLWDADTGVLFYTLHGHGARINAVAFSPDGKTLASCDHAGNIHLWEAGRLAESPSLNSF